ncbi:MAG: TonB family protein [Pyrinomonadaceae bacterium]
MLDQLVESKSSARENTRRSGFLFTTFVIVGSILMSAWLYSLFAQDYGLSSGDLELSALVAPVPVAEEEPPPEPEPEEIKPKEIAKAAPNVDVRKEIIQRMDESPKVPDQPSVVKNTTPPPVKGMKTIIGSENKNFENSAPASYRGPVSTDGKGIAGAGGVPNSGSEKGGTAPPPPPPPPPPPAKKVEPPAPKVPRTVSQGVINGKATSLPKPPYPAAARAVRASGAVNVSVKIDEQGNVVSASATSGHPLLRAAAVQAARSAKFAPTQLSGQPVSVTGIIVYNFVP